MHSNAPHIILIDGRSGVGKTSLSTVLATTLGATVLHLDDVYPGWGGLEEGRDVVIDGVLRDIANGRTGRVAGWDWQKGVPGRDITVTPADVVVIEGCGISTAEARQLADVVMWVDCPDSERRERLRRRDGTVFAAHQEEWDEQVRKHIADNDPIGTATVTVIT